MRLRLRELDPGVNCAAWSTVVTVRVRGPLRHFVRKGRPSTAQTTLVHDGTDDMAVVAFNDDAARLAAAAPVGRPVRIVGAEVQECNPDFQATRIPWEIAFGRDARAEPLPDVPPLPPPGTPERDDAPPTPSSPVDLAGYALACLGPRPRLGGTRGPAWDVLFAGWFGTADVRLGGPPVDRVCGPVLLRDVRRDGATLRGTWTTTVHPLPDGAGSGPPPVAWAGPACTDVAAVAGLARRGVRHCRVRATMVWHSAVGAYDDPYRWTARRARPAGASELRLTATLADGSGEMEVTVFAAMASELLGSMGRLLEADEASFRAACAGPLFRLAEWSVRLSRSLTDESIYLSVDDAVEPA